MFNEIGKKIKALASVICVVGIIGSLIATFSMFIAATEGPSRTEGLFIGYGVAILIIGPLASWIGSFFMYGFGELIDKTSDIQKYLCGSKSYDTLHNSSVSERNGKLESLRANGLITDEEYLQAVSTTEI